MKSMGYDHFVGRVQQRGRMATPADAIAAIRATLSALAERIDPDELQHLAAYLPPEIVGFLENAKAEPGEWSSLDALCRRVADREKQEVSLALFQARCVLDVVREAVVARRLQGVDVLRERVAAR